MIHTFERAGVRFRYPAGWRVEPDDGDGPGWAVTVQSPETAFLLVSLRPDADAPAGLAAEALAALRAEYPDLEADPVVEPVAGQPAVGHDIDFLTLDTPILAWTRCVDTVSGPLLLLCQASEFDRPRTEPVLRAICASLELDD